MKKIGITDEQLRMDFNTILAREENLPARLIYDISCNLLDIARDEENAITGRGYQWFVAHMVEFCHGVKLPPADSERLLTDEGLEALYNWDIKTRDFTLYITAVLTTVSTALQNIEVPGERVMANAIWHAHASFVNAIARWINEVGPNQRTDA